MRYKKAYIDSLNLSDRQIESIFIYHQDYVIEAVKTKSTFMPEVWSQTFGRALKRNIIEAKIIHTHLGLTLPLKTFSVTPNTQTLEFAGLHGYNERSKHLLQHLQALKQALAHTRVMRIDIAIDFKHKIPKRVIEQLSQHREPFRYANTTYYKTAKEKKSNQRVDIKIYNKQIQAKLDYPLYRLEFVFKGSYFHKFALRELQSVYKKMEKSIYRTTGLSVKIEPIYGL